jgi:hypothetical protein
MQLIPFSFSQHISAVCLRTSTVLSKNSCFVFSMSSGIAPWQTSKIFIKNGWRLLYFPYTQVFVPFIYQSFFGDLCIIPERKQIWQGSFSHLDKSYRITGDVKVTLDAVHYLKGGKTLSIIWVRFLPRFRLQIYNIYNSKNLKARLLFHLKCTNLGFAKHAIRVIGYYPTKSPSRHHPSLWYGSQSEHRGHRAEHAHRHKFLLPKCQVRIHLIRDHKDAKLLRRLCNLERKRTIDTIANH